MGYSPHHIAEIVNGHLVQSATGGTVEHLVIDSRKIIFPSTSIFFALSGPRRDGHSYVEEVYHKGVRNFIVSKISATTNWPLANFIEVSNPLQALQRLAAYHRSQFELPVIGITGSNGKTIVKEWLAQLLEEDFNVVRSPRSYNSQIGVPLSVWQIGAQHELGIFEAGISLPDEMKNLEAIIKPEIGIFTNIGEAHSEGFQNIGQKVREKVRLFENSRLVIYCSDDEAVKHGIEAQQREARSKGKTPPQIFNWGKDPESSLHIRDVRKKNGSTEIDAHYTKKDIHLTVPFTDDASIHNAITCWSTLICLDIDQSIIQSRILQLQHLSMRLELKKGINHCSILNDSYSADLDSLRIALDFLKAQRQHPQRTVIISDFLQTGMEGAALYEKIASALQEQSVDRIIGIGQKMIAHQDKFDSIRRKDFFSSTDEFIRHFHQGAFHNEAILLKGARVFEFERIDRLLAEKLHRTILEIDLDSLSHNLRQYRQLLKPGTRLMAMVKAFAYGSGSYEIASILQFNKVDYLAVAYADEGVELRKAGISVPIMVMNADEEAFPLLAEYSLQPAVYSLNLLKKLEAFLHKENLINFPIHVEINTGMNRLGFDPQQIKELVSALVSPAFAVTSVFSHFAASEDPQHDAFTRQQADIFQKCCESIQSAIAYPFLKHLSNTAAAERYPEFQFDMVRLGIGLYGIDPAPKSKLDLQEVSTLRSTIAQLRWIREGETVSYGRSGVAEKDTLVATVRLGYADGYPRSLGNGNGKIWVEGKLAPIIGTICMDMIMIDVTGIPGLAEGDEVVVFGKELPVSQVARWANTIPYEMLTGISQRVKRVYYQG